MGKRIADLAKEISHLADPIEGGLLKASPALARRLAAAEPNWSRSKLALAGDRYPRCVRHLWGQKPPFELRELPCSPIGA